MNESLSNQFLVASLSYRNLTLLGLGLIFWPAIAAHSAIRLTVKQVGNDVVVIGKGSANTNGLAPKIPVDDYTNVLTDTQIYAGPDAFTGVTIPPVDVNLWGGLTGPSLFGTDPNISETPIFGSGDLFGIVAGNGQGQSFLVLPSSYMSGDSLSGTSRFSNFTLADLGLSPGVLSWTWGTNPNADSLELRIVPAPGPLPLAGGAMAWSLAKRMRRASRGKRLHDHSKKTTLV
jgi:hypothetical protein